MSETKLVVRDETRDISMTCHGSDAHRVVAALSADPITIEELEVALQRFMNVDPHGFFQGADDCLDDEPWDSGLVVIDLDARLIVVDSTYFATTHSGQVFYHNGEHCTNITVGYSLADKWEISDDGEHWRHIAETRRRVRAGKASLDTRAVLYGHPLLEFLTSECWRAFFHRDEKLQSLAANRPDDSGANATYLPLNESLPRAAWSGDERERKGVRVRRRLSRRRVANERVVQGKT